MNRSILALIAVPLVLAVLWMFLVAGDDSQRAAAVPPEGDRPAEAHLEQAVSAVIVAAKHSVQASATDAEAATRVQASVEALRLLGHLGDIDTDESTQKLLDELQEGARPAVATSIIQLRIERRLQQWTELDASQRAEAIDRFVADVQEAELTPELAELFMRLTMMLEGTHQSALAARAIGELLPTFEASANPRIQRRASQLEGVLRRLPGKPMKLEGTLLDGSELDWDSFRGKLVLVDFFASWCGPCRAEVPNILQNYQAYRDQGFEVVGVNMDQDRQAAETYVQQAGFDFPTLFSDDPDATGWDHPMGRKYGVTALPRVILVDRDGTIIDTSARGPRLGMLLREHLGPPGAPTAEFSNSAEPNSAVLPAGFNEDAAP